jgi:hypothetical protein
MTVKLNQAGDEYAQELIERGKVVADDRDAWSEHQPTTEQENEFIDAHGYKAFGKWHLGIDSDAGEDTKARYKFPHGDLKNLHRCAILSAESRAGQYKHDDIRRAAEHLHGMVETAAARTR